MTCSHFQILPKGILFFDKLAVLLSESLEIFNVLDHASLNRIHLHFLFLHQSQLVDRLRDLLFYVLFMLAKGLNYLFHHASQMADL